MTPNVDERLASVVRALTEVILPHLPADASLAQEQAHLAIGHLQILRAQFDQVPAFEREELDDAIAIARALAQAITGGPVTSEAVAALDATAATAEETAGREQTTAINRAVDRVVRAVSVDGSAEARGRLPTIILQHEAIRVAKDREWFLPFGFDTLEQGS